MSAELLNFATQYSVYTGYLIFPFGATGNALNIFVFIQLKFLRNNRSALFMIVESCFSLMYQFLFLSLTILTSIYGDDATGRSPVWCRLRYILAQSFVLITYSMICFAAIDQFLSTKYRLNLRQICTVKLAQCFTIAFACLWIVHSIAFSFAFSIQPPFGCIISNPTWLRYSTFFFYPILIGLNVRRIVRGQLPIARRRLDRQMTAMVLLRTLFFICLISPYTIYRIYIINFPIPPSTPTAYAIGRLTQAILLSIAYLNHTVSFYVFLLSSSRFRRQVKSVLVKASRQWWKHVCCFKSNLIGPENTNVDEANMQLEEID